MRIAVNGKAFGRRARGGAIRAGLQLVEWIGRERPDFYLDVYAPGCPADSESLGLRAGNIRLHASRGPFYCGGFGRSAWEQARLPSLVRRSGADVLLSPTNSGPVLAAPGVPHLILVHDAGFLNESWYSRPYSRYVRWLLRRAAGKGARFATVSETSAAQIRRSLEIDAIDVVLNDSDEPPPDLEPADPGFPYILFLGSLNPRKNLAGALEGFRRFAIDRPTARLLVVGAEKSIFRDAAEGGAEAGSAVRFLGYVEDRDKWALLKGARLLLLPSFLEGFGLPVLEAMKVGTPVVASDIPVFRELFGDAVEFVDPASAEDIGRGIGRVFEDQKRRGELVSAGRRVSARFSWAVSARRYAEILEEMAASP